MTFQEFEPAARFVAGTVGPTGNRTFYLQASDGRRVVTVAVEKQQVSVLADRINDVLDQLAPTTAIEPGQPGGAPEDTEPLETPFEEDWRVQTLSLAWDEGRQCLVIECHDHDPDGSREPSRPRTPWPAVPRRTRSRPSRGTRCG